MKSMNRAIGSVLVLAVSGCFATAPDKKAECQSDANCRSGYACIDNACASPCATQSDCSSSQVCFTGYCVARAAGSVPSIDSVAGNADGRPVQVKDGFLVAGHGFSTAAFELDGDGWAAPLSVKSQSDTKAEVVWSQATLSALPAHAHQGAYQLVATNRSGSALASVSLLLPEYSGDDLVSRINTDATSPLSAAVMPPEFADFQARLAALESVAVIRQNMTINVASGSCDDLIKAMTSLENRPIASSALVTVQVSGGPYTCTDSLNAALFNGDRVQVLGNTVTPVEIDFKGVDGVVVGPRYTLALMDGFKLVGDKPTSASRGISVDGGTLQLGSTMEVALFGSDGVLVTHNGVLKAQKINVHDNAGSGVWAELGGIAHVESGSSSNSNGGTGFLAADGGIIFAEVPNGAPVTASSNQGSGFYAGDTGYIAAQRALASANTYAGFRANGGAYLTARTATAAGNQANGFEATAGSFITASGSYTSANAGNGYQCANAATIDARSNNVTLPNSGSLFVPNANSQGSVMTWIVGP